MKLFFCPMNGWRPEDEFVCGGAIKRQPDESASDAVWRDYLLMEENIAGAVWEWWCHVPSSFWFAACRDTVNDNILKTRTPSGIEKDIIDGTLDLNNPKMVNDGDLDKAILSAGRIVDNSRANGNRHNNASTSTSLSENHNQDSTHDLTAATRPQKIIFDFNGEKIPALSGDTVAVALWRAGIKTLLRSFKYHRRRGILSLSAADIPMDIDDAPNASAEVTMVREGMIVRTRHCIGGLEKDWLSGMSLLSRFLPPGFYYKAFYKPHGIWPKWEPLIRYMAGMGVVNQAAALQPMNHKNVFCDVAIIGGGPAGLAAAVAAAKQGREVCILDRNRALGGSYLWRMPKQFGDDYLKNSATEKSATATKSATTDKSTTAQVESLLSEVLAAANIRVLTDCMVTGVFDGLVVARCGNEALRLRAADVIYATGARDTPAVFVNNDLPGVMLLSAALRLAFIYDVLCGRQAAVLASCDADAAAVRALQRYGVNIAVVLNIGDDANAPWAEALATDGFAVHANIATATAEGRQSVKGIWATVGGGGGREMHFACDCVLMNGGFIPAAELPAAGGVSFPYHPVLRRPQAQDGRLAGGVHGRLSLAAAMADGVAAAADLNSNKNKENMLARPDAETAAAAENVFLIGKRKGKAFVDFDEDLQLSDLSFAADEGFDDVQLLKRYTTAGMGLSQGKLTNVLVMRYLATLRNCAAETIGQVTARPPAVAETFSSLAGGVHPIKRTALHSQHAHLSAALMPAGSWLRPAYYGDIEAEAQAVRKSAGIIDISTLGKILVAGPDAAKFLEQFYTGKFIAQKIGGVRYALLLDEMGVIVDDGVVARLDEERFWVTATTGNAEAVYRQMLLMRGRWNMQLDVINMTSAMAAINLAGPAAPALLAEIMGAEIELGYMKAKEVTIGGAPCLLMRVGFVGEKGYEIHLPSGYAMPLWNRLLPKARPFGVQAQRLLRLEKGHIIVGQDTDGLTTPLEADMEWALGRNKDFYFGKRALDIHRQRGIRHQLRGFVMDGKWRRRVDESDLILDAQGNASGRVTSVAYSPSLDCVIGLAHAPLQTPRQGGTLRLRSADGVVMQARTVPTPFYDPSGERQQ